ncbi:TetR family transcriptional regulator [Streptomyces sp. NPDC003456]|uniref:TetR/AcrR family transcriptional regulator n=1 Tax=Streptomyces sp. NPDC003456 TaxID=3364683 RepID=UPI0036B1EF67
MAHDVRNPFHMSHSPSSGESSRHSRAPERPDPPRVAWRKHMRRRILSAAHELACTSGWENVSLAEVALLAEVSRPSVYKEFGNRAGLGQALVTQESGHLLRGVAERLESTPGDARSALEAAMLYVLTEAERNPLVSAVVSAARRGSDSLLPYLTARPDPVFDEGQALLGEWLRVNHRDADAEDIELTADMTVRMTISHLVLPRWDPPSTARRLSSLVLALMDRSATSGAQRPVSSAHADAVAGNCRTP